MKYISIIPIMLLLFSSGVFAQTSRPRDTPEQVIIKKTGVSEGKAKEVVLVLNAYTTELKTVVGDKSLSQISLREKVDQLMAVKNEKLSKILNADQLYKVISTTERLKIDPEFAKQYMAQQQKLKNAAIKSTGAGLRGDSLQFMQMQYAQAIRRINMDPTMTAENKRLKIEQLTIARKESMSKYINQQRSSKKAAQEH